MGALNNKFIEVSNWLKSDRNYNDGVFLYNKYGNNQNLKILFPGKEKFHAQKLAYELAKLIGVGFHEFNNDILPGEILESVPVQTSENSLPNPGQTVNPDQPPVNRKEIEYPVIIKRVTHEYSRLYKERAMLKNQQNNIPDENIPENVAKRKELIDLIEIYSARMDILNKAREDYFSQGILPEEKDLFAVQEKESSTIDELESRLKNLRSYQSKDNNILLYQKESKQDKPNPLPDSPKKEKIVKRMADRDNEMKDIEQKMKDASDKDRHTNE